MFNLFDNPSGKEAVVRPLNPFDIIRCTLLDEPERLNRAHTLGNIAREGSFALSLIDASRKGMSPKGKSASIAITEGVKVCGVASGRQRYGPQSWEITHLYLGSNADSQLLKLLDNISQVAGAHRSERVYLRLHREDPLLDVARQSGFFPRIPEVLFQGSPTSAVNSNGSDVSYHIRGRMQQDDHDLFRLYNAATPSEVRYAVGMTLEQWSSSQEPIKGDLQEFVLVKEDAVRGSLRIGKRSGVGLIQATVHPDDSSEISHLVDFGLSQLGAVKTVYCLVPEFQVDLQNVLKLRGFGEVADYVTLVKTMTVRALQKECYRVAVPTI